MKLNYLKCRYFRNLEDITCHFSQGLNVITGDNGQGKTNIVEAIYYLSLTRSFRVQDDRELIMDGKDCGIIDCSFTHSNLRNDLRCVVHNKGKTCFVSNQIVPKTSEFIGKLNAILFVPSDIEIFHVSPKQRRRMMDIEIGKLDNTYSFHLSRYNQLMKERNMLFKLSKMDENHLDVIEFQMSQSACHVYEKRKKFIEFLNKKINENYKKLSCEQSTIQCFYKSFSEELQFDINKYKKLLKQGRDKDFILRKTSMGIHRDDLVFMMNQHLVDSYASQGQRRMIVLALKLCFVDFVQMKAKTTPVLLLDDVLSELDIEKRRNLFSAIPNGVQTIMTTTEIKDLDITQHLDINLLRIHKGQLSVEEEQSDVK